MKKKSIIGLFVCLLGFGTATTSCEDMLTPDLDRYALEFSGTDTVGFYLGILREVQEVIEQNALLGEIRGDLAVTTEYSSDSISDIANFRSPEDGDNNLLNRAAYYKVINQCNFYLAKVDTMAVVRGNYYMRKECAQVELIRAWVYMQLVQNYGRVPFITKPVDRANTGWETNPEEGWVDADNLLDKLQAGLEQAAMYEKTLGFPNYGTFETGNKSITHQLLLFPSDVVLGDLYLLRGHSGDYEKAASHYYEYMVDFYEAGRAGEGTASYGTSNTSFTSSEKRYYPSVSNWTTGISSGDLITMVPSAANSFFGMVLTRVPQVYGFDVTSSNTTVGGTNDDGSDATTTSGNISLTANYKNRQVAPSQYFENLAASQIVRDYDNYVQVGEDWEPQNVLYPDLADARLVGSAPYVNTEKGRLRFIQKMGSGSVDNTGVARSFTFNYLLPVYRMRQVYLRYAEAVNRAGFPRYAFTLLRDGLDAEMMPRVLTDSFINIDDVAQTKQECPYLEKGTDLYGQLSVDEVRRAEGVSWLDFSAQYWLENSGRTVAGAHERGCGDSYAVDTLYTYENVVLKRIADEEARTQVEADAQTARMRILAEAEEDAEDPEEPTEPDRSEYAVLPAAEPAKASAAEINAVETLIAEEMALETAYEGFRFYDLMRIARHKNNDLTGYYPADYGTQWLAWLVSRRALPLKPYENPSEKDESLYSILLNPSNWYLTGPKE